MEQTVCPFFKQLTNKHQCAFEIWGFHNASRHGLLGCDNM